MTRHMPSRMAFSPMVGEHAKVPEITEVEQRRTPLACHGVPARPLTPDACSLTAARQRSRLVRGPGESPGIARDGKGRLSAMPEGDRPVAPTGRCAPSP